jgi:solute carrier family 25 carnitine/acylcarnitine transporter 20/29
MDFAAGTFAGVLQAITCHPLDTMKTVRQANMSIQWNPRFLYRGLSVPLLSNGAISTVTYGVYYHSKTNGCSFATSCALAGFAAGVVCGPVELYKIRLQIPKKVITKTSPFLGTGCSIVREMPSMFVYYAAYEHCEAKGYSPLLGGGIAGLCGWLAMFHIDVVKTRIQSGAAKTVKDAIRMGNMNRGLGYCLMRAAPHNAIGFWGFHWFKQQFEKENIN